jgi:hypothetical protein
MAITGFLCGGGFAGVLALIERRKSLLELNSVRAGLWAFWAPP